MSPLAAKWFELERTFSPATRREQNFDARKSVAWDELDHFVRIGALATACALLEAAGMKQRDEHIRLLFELRNAMIHNSGDLGLNRNPNALVEARAYLASAKHLQLSPQLTTPFFSLHGTRAELHPNLYFAVRLCML